MATWLKQSTAVDIGLGPFVDSADGVTPETGLTISQADVRLKKNAGNWAQKNQSSSATHEENGWYEVNLDTTDTNTLGILLLAVYETGALPVWREFLVVPANVYDSYLSTDLLQVDLTQVLGAGVSTSTAQIGVNTVSLSNNAITAAAINADAITAAKVADGTIDAATFAAGAINAAAIADGAIDAATFATDSITSTALAASAVTEIQSGLATSAALATVQADTDDIQTRLPAALVSGRIDASVGAMAANTLTASALAADAVTEIQSGLATSSALATVQSDTDDIQTRLPAALVGGRMDSSVGAMAANTLTASALAADAVTEVVNGVWDEPLTGASHNVNTSSGKRLRELSGAIVISGTAQGGTINSITLATSASTTDGTYDPSLIRIVSGTGAGQARLIIDYAGSTRIAAVARDWRTIPDATSQYEVIAAPNLISINEGWVAGATANSVTLNADASASDNVYIGQTVLIRTGTGQDQSRIISAYNGTTKVATLAQPWVVQPTTSSGYMIVATGRAMLAAALADTITASALAADAVSEIQSGLSTLDAAGVRAAVGLASANLDTQLDTLPTAVENADALLKRDFSSVTGEASRSVLNALRFMRNRWSVVAGVLTVRKEDDATTAWTAAVTSDPAAEPIIGSDPT